MGETRVDLLHLLEDLRDAYPGSLEETIVSEVVANALDSGAGAIAFSADPVAATLTVVDDGRGMARRATTTSPRAASNAGGALASPASASSSGCSSATRC